MNDTIDLLQIKIEKAKAQLSEDTLKAIGAVPWQATILKMREEKGYSFEQLSDLEIETELLLCGLLSPEDYPKELENRLKLSKGQAAELVSEMNKLVFVKIREEMIKNTERKKMLGENSPETEIFAQNNSKKSVSPDTEEEKTSNTKVLNTAGIEIIGGNGKLPVLEKLELPNNSKIPPILIQKLSGSFQIPIVKTEHVPENITKTSQPANIPPPAPEIPKVSVPYPKNNDPYRLPPE